jgi:NADPH-dependent ferric siderophore reductase
VVAGVADVGPRMRRVTLAGEALTGFVALPGQDVVLHLAGDDGGGISRRYTIRHLDNAAGRVDLDVVLHGAGPGARWAAAAQVGDGVEVFGPRGKVRLADASWQLLLGDESALPGIAELIAVAPAQTTAVALIDVQDGADEQVIDAAARVDVRWLHRGGATAGESDLLDRALADIEIPDADRHAYVFGESRTVRRLRDELGRRGLRPAEISAKGYWNLGRAASD